HLVLVATGGTERRVLELVAARATTHPGEPVILLAHGAHNSLPAALEALAAMQQADRRGRIVFLTGDDGDTDRVLEAVHDLDVLRRLHHVRLGLIGGPSSWLVASRPSSDVVRRSWGPIVEVVDPSELVVRSAVADPVEVEVMSRRFAGPATTTTVSTDAVEHASAVATGLATLVADHALDAVSVRCFDLLEEPGTSGCLGLAALNEDRIVAGCEGDLPSTLAMLWAQLLLDRSSWMANPASIDVERNRVVLAHCTVAPSIVDDFALDSHFESGGGVGIGGHLPSEPVTLIRIGGRDLDEVWIAEGAVIESGRNPELCRTQATIRVVDRDVEELLDRPLGNHLTLVPGHHRRRLERWWRFAVA
ncbi:MAG: hypothetical protein AAFP84_11680, partial [Actinomycetota bacterium]